MVCNDPPSFFSTIAHAKIPFRAMSPHSFEAGTIYVESSRRTVIQRLVLIFFVPNLIIGLSAARETLESFPDFVRVGPDSPVQLNQFDVNIRYYRLLRLYIQEYSTAPDKGFNVPSSYLSCNWDAVT